MRWRLLLEEFSPEIVYIKGHQNVIPDALSRLPKRGDIVDGIEAILPFRSPQLLKKKKKKKKGIFQVQLDNGIQATQGKCRSQRKRPKHNPH